MNTRLAWEYRGVLVPVALCLAGCTGGGGGGRSAPTDAGTDLPEVTAVMGRVLEPNGDGLAEVRVTTGTDETTSASDGTFELETQAGSSVVVELLRPGYLRGLERLDVLEGTPTALEVTLMPEAAPVALDADAGGTATGARGASMIAPGQAFVDASGNAVVGEVQVHLTPLDPAVDAELAAYPGDLRAETADGTLVQLETLGVLDVTVRQNGEDLQIADDQSIEIRIPAPSSGADTWPATVPLWSFDEQTADWVEEGTATYDATDHTYGGTITHLSPWNADLILDATCVRGTVVDEQGNPIPGALIQTAGIDYLGTSSATADQSGQFCVVVRSNSRVRITAIHPLGGGTTREVTSGSAATTVPPNCSTCDDQGNWTVEQGSVTGPSGQQTDCADLGNPYTGTCVEPMMDMFVCFDPQGACTYDLDQGVIVYDNGVRMTTAGTLSQLYGPSGQECGSIETVIEGTEYSTLYTDAAGETWTLRTTDQSDTVIECSDGTTVTVTSEESAVLNACSGAGSAAAEECTIVGTGLPGTCTSDTDCAAGEVCCVNVGYCLPDIEGICDAAGA